ncbi:P-loop containing nucleoside triphosphate hydrolase protein [Dunaliella salina]|uniref:P-loop containing nucleoside triphosphate hydrolase protein n=1 Tax=Dunaliella salina TaxID=3046 RepID=A0ABQ7GGN2_DUNSA|nr:P-loop containing nucleoside triphosphate hydrolase protein [Dunaliella salina]|eukprot:KAF5833766.1 P-loop containing nucleoside triphosphate hydrolase protein [Dunaliella salina]
MSFAAFELPSDLQNSLDGIAAQVQLQQQQMQQQQQHQEQLQMHQPGVGHVQQQGPADGSGGGGFGEEDGEDGDGGRGEDSGMRDMGEEEEDEEQAPRTRARRAPARANAGTAQAPAPAPAPKAPKGPPRPRRPPSTNIVYKDDSQEDNDDEEVQEEPDSDYSAGKRSGTRGGGRKRKGGGRARGGGKGGAANKRRKAAAGSEDEEDADFEGDGGSDGGDSDFVVDSSDEDGALRKKKGKGGGARGKGGGRGARGGKGSRASLPRAARNKSKRRGSSESDDGGYAESDDEEEERVAVSKGKRGRAHGQLAMDLDEDGGGAGDGNDLGQVEDGNEEQAGVGGEGEREGEDDEDVIPGGRTRKQRRLDLARQQRTAEVEKILQYDPHRENGQGAFLVKFQGMSYRKAGWVPRNNLMQTRAQLSRNFLSKGVPIHPEEEEWLQAERIIQRRQLPPNRRPKGVGENSVHNYEYLVKWRGLEYGDATWERADDLRSDEAELISRYERFNTPPPPTQPVKFDAKTYQMPTFKNSRVLRDYQETAVRWMVSNYMANRNCMLGDEMGLGKTAQCIAVLESLRLVGGVQLPFLLVAPLTTLGHWQREIETWTDMNVVLYVGSAADRQICQKTEFYYPSASLPGGGRGGRRGHPLKFDALLISYETLLKEQSMLSKALYAKQIGTLLTGVKNANLPGLKNLAMELRKLCCHPFLCEGLEEDITARRALAVSQAQQAGSSAAEQHARLQQLSELEMLVRSCGKMVLLSKLLPRLREEGRRVLIFSQFTRMLDVLQDYMRMAGWPVERIDGSVKSRDRQAAIDRFTNGTPESSFVFLLSTRAGGQGITLTAADTAIIYDSDWNPQNDLQAMARCHRIGQQKEVTVYRLVTRDTYEEHLFQTASRKYGLDEAVLGFGPDSSADGDPENNAKRVAALLEHGAHGLLSAGAQEGVEQASAAFQNADIDQVGGWQHGRSAVHVGCEQASTAFQNSEIEKVGGWQHGQQ